MLTDAEQQRIKSVLKTHYGHMPSVNAEWLDSVCGTLRNESMAAVEDALHKHIIAFEVNNVGRLVGDSPPTIAQLLRNCWETASRLQAEAAAAQELLDEERIKRNGNVWVNIPKEVQHHFPICDKDGNIIPGRFRKRARAWRTTCKECGNTGLARFYYDYSDKKRVWLATEWLALPQAVMDTLRCSQALCDCERGMNHKMRGNRFYYEKRMRYMSTYPCLEFLRVLSHARQGQEQISLGVTEIAKAPAELELGNQPF